MVLPGTRYQDTWPRPCGLLSRCCVKAGKLYDDAKKGQNDETLEAALFAAANTD